MKILSWNTRGLGDISKGTSLKHFLQHNDPFIVMIQETKNADPFTSKFSKSLLSSNEINWARLESIGKSGVLTMWDESKVQILEICKGGYTLSNRVSSKIIRYVGF